MSLSWGFDHLTEEARDAYTSELRSRFPFAHVELLERKLQGGCSLTFVLHETSSSINNCKSVLQIRPARFTLDLSICNAASAIYGGYAPSAYLVTLLASDAKETAYLYRISFAQGTPYSYLRPTQTSCEMDTTYRISRYIISFADFLARSWHHRRTRQQQACDGKVGSQLFKKIGRLTVELPTLPLKHVAAQVFEKIHLLRELPLTLCHGDVLPSNILINESTCSIEAFIDWAEAEWLPFGIPLYGLEHFLGIVQHDPAGRSRFVYRVEAQDLRELFWRQLRDRLPDLFTRPALLEAIELTRIVGILLWFGFAWDDGAIHRVVNPETDATEVMLLETFLDIPLTDRCKPLSPAPARL